MVLVVVAAIGVLGLLATQVELSGAKEKRCGTALRIDLRRPTVLREDALDLLGAGDGTVDPVEAERRARELLAEADELEDRCKDRQRLALLAFGAGGAAVMAAVAWSAYQLGRRAVTSH